MVDTVNGEDPSKDVCFLVGPPRSGTTWIQRLLQSHPLICGGEESHFFTLFASPLRTADRMFAREERRIGPLCYVDRRRFENSIHRLWMLTFADLYQAYPESLVHLEKTPFHSFCLDQITRVFPKARIIFLVRDSRATVSSLVHAGRTWGNDWAPDNWHDAAIEWQRHVRAACNWNRDNLHHAFLKVRYEDVLADTRGELERMLNFLLPATEDIQLDATLQTFEATQAEMNDPEGFSRRRGTQGWKTDMSLYGKFVTWRYTRKLMRDLGYDISILD